MASPSQLQTTATRATFAGVNYTIEGTIVPVLHLQLGGMPVYFEHHVLLWKDPQVQIYIKQLRGAFKRVLSGMPIFMTEAGGPGSIAFSRDGVGHIFPMHLNPGQGIEVREHQFLAASASVDFTFNRVKGAANIFLGNSKVGLTWQGNRWLFNRGYLGPGPETLGT